MPRGFPMQYFLIATGMSARTHGKEQRTAKAQARPQSPTVNAKTPPQNRCGGVFRCKMCQRCGFKLEASPLMRLRD